MWAHDKVGVFAEMGILAPITDVIALSELSGLLPMTLNAGLYGGANYQLPIYYEALLFMYNKALLDAPPASTDELLEKMKAETTNEQYVFVEQHSTSYNSAAWIQGFGGYIINADKQPGLGLQETKNALAYHKEFVPYMPADGEYNTVTALFTEGKAMMTIGGPWLVPGLKEAGVDLGIAPMPLLPNGSPLKPFSGVQGVHVLKHAAENKKEAVAELFRVLASPKTGIALANKEAEAMFGPDVDMVFRTGNGMVALLIDKDKEELVLESMNEDGTDRKRVLTIPQGNALVRGALSRWGGDGWLLVNGWGTRAPTEGVQYRDYYYYYQPANEYMVFSITCPDHLAWGVDMALTRSAFLWSHETEEHYQKRKERGAQLTGPNEVLDIECYIYDIYVGKSYYLGRTFLYGGEVWETYYRLNTDSPTFKEWMASYLEQRNKDIAAMR